MNPIKPIEEFTFRELKDCRNHFLRTIKSCENLLNSLNDVDDNHEFIISLNQALMLAKKDTNYKGEDVNRFKDLLIINLNGLKFSYGVVVEELSKREIGNRNKYKVKRNGDKMRDKQVSIKYIDKHGEHCTFTCFESEMKDVLKIITTSGGTNIVAPGLYEKVINGEMVNNA